MKFIKNLIDLFYPELCQCCESQLHEKEQLICITCRHDLPYTYFSNLKNNPVDLIFYGHLPLKAGTALFFFNKKGKVQQLIHSLKYRNQQKVGTLLGLWLARELQKSPLFKDIDCIVPVPLHPSKLKKRGYNQLTLFGKQMAASLQVPFIPDSVERITQSSTQTNKSRNERLENIREHFALKNTELITKKNVLVIDDIITTGATLTSLCACLLKADIRSVSIACMAYTK